jgi:hypothetical protein
MLSKNKTAKAIAAWIRDRLQENGSDRSLIDDTDNPGILVESVSAQGQVIELAVSVVEDDKQIDYKFKINVGMVLPIEPEQS